MLELHSSARFARLHKAADPDGSKPGPTGIGLVLLVIHNLIYWFFLVPFLTPMSYATGFAIYSGILLTRLLANTWINVRDMTWEQYYAYPLRIP